MILDNDAGLVVEQVPTEEVVTITITAPLDKPTSDAMNAGLYGAGRFQAAIHCSFCLASLSLF